MNAQRPIWRGSDAFLRNDGTVVVMSGRVAALLTETLDLDSFRGRVRGRDSELDWVLQAMHRATLVWRGAVVGTTVAPVPPSLRPSTPVSTATAAAVLGLKVRAVRRAIAEKRLPATKVGGVWLIDQADLDKRYRSARRAA